MFGRLDGRCAQPGIWFVGPPMSPVSEESMRNDQQLAQSICPVDRLVLTQVNASAAASGTRVDRAQHKPIARTRIGGAHAMRVRRIDAWAPHDTRATRAMAQGRCARLRARIRYAAETGFRFRMTQPLRPRRRITDTPRATISDVAAKAGVSKATVSRFLNRREELLTPEIAVRVERAIQALAYSPSPMARALKRGRSRLIGLIVADVTNPFSVAVLRGAERACQEAGYLLMLFNLGNDAYREREAIEALMSYQVEGLILNTLGGDQGAVADALRHGKPMVLVDRRHQGVQTDFVSLDNVGAVRMAAQHLVDAGYRELLFVSEPLAHVSSRLEREAAFRAFVADHAPNVAGRTFESSGATPAALDEALRMVRARARRGKAAVLAANAVITLRLADSAARLGWRFGQELGLVGFDETEWAPLIGSGITTVAQPTDDLGRLAATCLIERLNGLGVPPRQILLPGRIVVRGSSHPEVAKAT
jgi:LacI family transcriptional regulator, kdg operon repressor